jgi:hypothetical protein
VQALDLERVVPDPLKTLASNAAYEPKNLERRQSELGAS